MKFRTLVISATIASTLAMLAQSPPPTCPIKDPKCTINNGCGGQPCSPWGMLVVSPARFDISGLSFWKQ